MRKRLVDWPLPVQTAIGRELLNILMREMVITRDREGQLIVGGQVCHVSDTNDTPTPSTPATPHSTSPAFYKVYRPRNDSSNELEELKPHPSLVKLYSHNKMVDLKFKCDECPMVVPPLPWLDMDTGGYLVR